MADKNKKSNGDRLLVFEPNPDDNRTFSTEDLSILVELTTYRKKRSIISSGQVHNNTNNGKNGPINFIGGSVTNVDKNTKEPEYNLTTNYTNATTTFDGDDEGRDLETLGIENIHISFDTAYTPKITIKFIDVRGNSIFQQGNKSKYSAFFDMPYPIFELKVKGFYGKPVTYCLHMIKWNSNFNSETGNFEIKADFIGYTYALLTDMLLGLIRAVVKTDKGKIIWEQEKEKDSSLQSIDEFMEDVDKLGQEFDKVKNDDENSTKIKESTETLSIIDKLKERLTFLMTNILDGKEYKVDNKTGFVVTTKSKGEDKKGDLNELIKSDVDAIIKLLDDEKEGFNTKITNEDFTINSDDLTKYTKIGPISGGTSSLESTKISKILISGYANEFSGDDNDSRDEMVEIIQDFSPKANDSYIYDFRKGFKLLNELKIKVKEENKRLNEELARNLASNATENLGFKPNIRNIIKMLVKHSEVFLKVLTQVSKEAYDSDRRSKTILDKLNKDNGINQNTDIKKVYPWPEYFQKSSNENNEVTQEEAWIGNLAPGIIEVKFVEELLEKLLEDYKKDIAEIESQVTDENSLNYYPISPLDTVIPKSPNGSNYNKNNPYYNALVVEQGNRTTPEEAETALILRGWLGLGFSNYSRLTNNMIEFMGFMEAENLFNTLLELNSDKKRDIINKLKNEDLTADKLLKPYLTVKKGDEWQSSDFKVMQKVDLTDSAAGFGDDGNGDGNKSIVGSYYYYHYLQFSDFNEKDLFSETLKYRGTNIPVILPINKGFNGKIFKDKDGRVKSLEELNKLKDEYFFIDNSGSGFDNLRYNTDGALNNDSSWFNNQTMEPSIELGSDQYFKILNPNEYNDFSTSPNFGTKFFKESQEKIINIFTEDSIGPWIRQNTLARATYTDVVFDKTENSRLITDDESQTIPNSVYLYGGRLKANEISDIEYGWQTKSNERKYDGYHYNKVNLPDNISDVLSIYWQNDIDSFGSDIFRGGNFLGGKWEGSIWKDVNNKEIKWSNDGWKSSVQYSVTPKFIYDFDDDNSYTPTSFTLGAPSVMTRVTPTDFGKQPQLIGFLNETAKTEDITLKKDETFFPFFDFGVNARGANQDKRYLSLFGSRFYYEQDSNEARAFLFLNSFGWKGVLGKIGDRGGSFGQTRVPTTMFDRVNYEDESFFEDDYTITLKGLYNNYGSFIKAPKLWCAFIGSLLYRYYDAEDKFIKYVSSGNTTYPYFLPYHNSFSKYPTRREYLKDSEALHGFGIDFFQSEDGTLYDDIADYNPIDETILYLPLPVRREFIRIFLEFTEGKFQEVRKEYELMYTEDPSSWEFTKWKTLNEKLAERQHGTPTGNHTNYLEKFDSDGTNMTVGELKQIFSDYGSMSNEGDGLKNYASVTKIRDKCNDNFTITPWGCDVWEENDGGTAFQINLVNRNGTKGSSLIKNLITEYNWILNGKPRVFRGSEVQGNIFPYKLIKVDDFNYYINAFLKRFRVLAKDYDEIIKEEKDEIQKEIFKTIDDDTIKLTIYRELSSIYNKWIGDNEKKTGTSCSSSNNFNLFESFKFIDRSYNDIGDKFFINPFSVKNLILGKPNTTLFTLLDIILKDNNFNFIPLPTYIDYSDPSEIYNVFKPYPYSKAYKTNQGPSFVCMYVGQTSNNLDLGEDSQYPDDSFTILKYGNDGTGKDYLKTKVPEDFNTPSDGGKNLNIPFFLISYGQQNQSIFKNLKLDQTEFTATLESLNAVEDLSQLGDKAKPTYKGQNLWNIYQNRAYTCEVDTMGNAMIQPFMYFQLSNVPMFRGAYSIFKVTHTITPHKMDTKFKGVRIKKTKTPLITENELYSNLLSYLNGTTDEGSKNSGAPINYTLQDSSDGIIIS